MKAESYQDHNALASKYGIILDTLPGVIAGIMKKKYGRGPENQKIYFNDKDVVVYIYGFLHKFIFQKICWNDKDVSETVRKYYYTLTKEDLDGIRSFFMETYNVRIERVFCDFDISSNEGVFIFRSI